jgi:DNA-binding MarR family transcriptional regulator
MSKLSRTQLTPLLARAMRRFIANAILFNQQRADRFGINATDYQILNLIDLSGGETPKALADLTALTTGGVTVALDRLERAGYIIRERNPADRRSIIVRIVPERIQPVHEYYREINAGVDQIFASFSKTDLRTIHEFFTKANAMRPRAKPPASIGLEGTRPSISARPSSAKKL